jgi:hypothetical protein
MRLNHCRSVNVSRPAANISPSLKAPERVSMRHVRPILGGLAALAAYDFVAPDLLNEWGSPSNANIVGFLLGLLAGQPLLLAVWAVLGPWRFWRRWLAALAAGICLYAVLLAGLWIAGESRTERQMFAVNFLFLPFVFLCAQFPLWLLRLGLGRGLRHVDSSMPAVERGVQFGTRDALTAIALFGISLGLARIGALLHNVERIGDGMQPWIGLAIACAFAGLWSATAVLPCVWAAFLTRYRVAASLAVVAYLLLLAACVSAALALVLGFAAPGDTVGMLLSLHAGLLMVVLLGCQKIRGWGYTLIREDSPN